MYLWWRVVVVIVCLVVLVPFIACVHSVEVLGLPGPVLVMPPVHLHHTCFQHLLSTRPVTIFPDASVIAERGRTAELCCLSVLPVCAACLCCLSVLPVCAVCLCCLSVLSVLPVCAACLLLCQGVDCEFDVRSWLNELSSAFQYQKDNMNTSLLVPKHSTRARTLRGISSTAEAKRSLAVLHMLSSVVQWRCSALSAIRCWMKTQAVGLMSKTCRQTDARLN